jgi:hypothetical protein
MLGTLTGARDVDETLGSVVRVRNSCRTRGWEEAGRHFDIKDEEKGAATMFTMCVMVNGYAYATKGKPHMAAMVIL